ncbi:Ku protein [Hoyosella altamirensis]|uniref:Non-homologous end joining protein Ku n=1 Tax=Hoyosella altamirensis TaxID=616997 RepID=A0A839RUD1_9ACTN|nr:Ku protein [Hoyosella altamirensis]MBB3039503.1 DNA end-binding protein Ku [Hoyosella altamirensis]
MRSIWKGALTFGLVNVPVKVYAATEDHDISFHQVHAEDRGRIRYRRICEECGKQVEFRDIAKAYTSDDDEMVIITDEDLASIPKDITREIEVVEFVPADQLDPVMFDRAYYLEPDGKSTKAYQLLQKTLAGTDRIAIAHFALRSKTRLAALRVKGKTLMVQTLLWPDEIRDPEFSSLEKEAKISKAELDMANQVVDSMTKDFEPDQHADEYQEKLRELIENKLAQGESYTPPEPAGESLDKDVSDLLASLEATLKASSQKK